MFTRKQTEKKTLLDERIDDLLLELGGHDGDSDGYAKTLGHLTKLNDIKTSNRPDRVSKDVMATVGANLAGILIIVSHERAHVIGSKALGFIMKAR